MLFDLLWLCLFISSFPPENSSSDNHVCSEAYTTRKYFDVKCGPSCAGTCTRSVSETYYRNVCCSGWDNFPDCNEPSCGGKSNPLACKISYADDQITLRNGTVNTNSGGYCSSPNNCTDCNDGFYSTGPTCEICPKIPNCHHRKCTKPLDNRCEMCYFETAQNQYYRAYKYDSEVKECRSSFHIGVLVFVNLFCSKYTLDKHPMH